MADRTDKWMQLLTALGMMRGVAGTPESQIHTNEQVDPRVRSALPRLQAFNVFLGWCGFCGGMLLMGGGIVWLLDLRWDPRSYLLAWIALALVAGAISGAVRRWLGAQVQVVQSFATVLAFLFVVLAVGAFLSSARERYNPLRLGGMVAGAGLVYASLLFLYNQSLDLANPYWRQSPLEREMTRQIFPAIRGLLEAADDDREVEEVDPRITFRRMTPRRADDEDGDEEEPAVQIAPEAGNLIWFVTYAAQMRGLSIRDLTMRPAPVLPFLEDGKELRLRRGMIRRLLARGSTEDVVEVDGRRERGLGDNGWWHLRGQGATAEWAKPPAMAVQDARGMWQEAMGDAPFPRWDGGEYVALRAA